MLKRIEKIVEIINKHFGAPLAAFSVNEKRRLKCAKDIEKLLRRRKKK